MNLNKRPPRISESRRRLAKVRVLVADRDRRTATLVHGVLNSFGFKEVRIITCGSETLETLKRDPFDLIITEWNLANTGGLELVRAIRDAKDEKLLKRDIPIIMLTARADVDAVQAARDAGITEFLVKPFTAATLSHRLIQVIDNPRAFIDAPVYAGPDRRRRGDDAPGSERRGTAEGDVPLEQPQDFTALPPNRELQKIIGEDLKATDIFTEELVTAAQTDLQKQESVFLDWARDDVMALETAFAQLKRTPNDDMAHVKVIEASYAIKSQAGMFGYHLGTEIAGNLVEFLEQHPNLTEDNLTVLRKHIDTIAVIFHQKIKEPGFGIGAELRNSLQRLISKLG